MLFKQATPVPNMVNVWDITLRIEGKDKPVRSDVILLIDTSGSMKTGTPKTRMQAAKDAANAFVDALLPSDNIRIGVVSFAEMASIKQQLTNNATTLETVINNLSATGGTFTQAGVKQAAAMLNTSADHKFIVLLSDGEPTYSYRMSNPDSYLIPYGNDKETSSNAPESAYLYGTNDKIGTGSNMRWQYGSEPGHWEGWTWVPGYDKYYNHGNSAIAQAGFAGAAGLNIFTVGLQTNSTGSAVLNNMKQGMGTFTEVTNVDQLTPVFETIAGQIGAAVKDAKITDPMGVGFQVLLVRFLIFLRLKEHHPMIRMKRESHGILVH